ncbi:MAG TPA: hypothetical protein VNT51_04245, partial [Miltoncostaeaceae bacterium]|nr:hypothetical protein [Miltoncostaeaceae bacterium]
AHPHRDRAAHVITGPVALDLARGPLGVAVARRVVSAVCAQAGLGVDRLQDAAILAETLAEIGPRADGARLRMELQAARGAVTVRVGPLPAGGAGALRAQSEVPGVGSVLERLADTLDVRQTEAGDEVVLSFGEPGLGPPGQG